MSDLIERLRGSMRAGDLTNEAADALEAKDKEIAALKTCLERALVFLGNTRYNMQAISEIRTTLYALYEE